MSLPNIRVVIREAADQNLTVDVPNVAVTVQQDSQYNVNIIPNSTVTLRTGSFVTYADLSALAFTASYALAAEAAVGSIQSASYAVYADSAGTATSASHAIYADTAGYAPSEWNAVANKPAGIVSSSTQVDYTQIQNQPTLIQSSSYAANADLFDGRNSTTFAGTGSNTFIGTQTISGSLLVSGALSTLDYVDLVLDGNPPHVEGRIFYNIDDHAVTYYNEITDVAIQLGQEQVLRARNASGQLIPNGAPVKITGAQGNRPTIEHAVSEINAAVVDAFDQIVGVATHDIPHNTDGYVTTQGVVRGVNLSNFTAGDILYVNTGSGILVNAVPPAPYDVMQVGIVIVAGNNGQLFVKPQEPMHLHDLSGVSNDAPEQGDLLVFQSSSLIWEKRSTNINISGSFYGTASWASQAVSSSYTLTASSATSASYAPTILPAGIVSSSAQINTGSFTGSFTGQFVGTSSWAQNAVTASAATSITFVPTTASYAVTASYAANVSAADFNTLLNKPTLVSSSAQVNTGSFTGSFVGVFTGTSSWAQNVATASFAQTALTASYFSGSMDFPNGLSVTGSVLATAGFTGSLQGTSSWASNTVSASYALTSSYAINAGAGAGFPFSGSAVITGSLVVSSSGINVIGSGITGSLLGTASWAQNAVTASYFSGSVLFENGLVITGSLNVSGSITGSLMGTASWATNAISSSYAVTSSLALNNIVTASAAASTITFTKGDGSQFSVTVAQSGSVESSSYATSAGSAISASYAVTASAATSITFTPATASYAITASYAENAGGAVGFPFSGSAVITGSLLVSGSGNISASSANIPSITGSLLGTSSWASTAISSSYAVTASYAETAVTSSYFSGSVRFPDGLSVTGSLNVSGSITGSLLGTSSWASDAISSSYAVTASAATSITFVPATASYAATASFLDGYASFPNGLIVTGSVSATSFTGSFVGDLLGTASYSTQAITSSYATTASTLIQLTIIASASLSPQFAIITSGSQHLTNGTYTVSSILNDSTFVDYRISGLVSWYTGSVNTTDIDEVVLHRNGRSASSASFFMRTNSISGSVSFLEIGCDYIIPSSSYTFTFVKVI